MEINRKKRMILLNSYEKKSLRKRRLFVPELKDEFKVGGRCLIFKACPGTCFNPVVICRNGTAIVGSIEPAVERFRISRTVRICSEEFTADVGRFDICVHLVTGY